MRPILRRSIRTPEGKVEEPFKPDIKDRKLLWYLSQNYRLSLNTLSRLVSLSKDAIKYRMNRLFKEGVIVGSIPIINMPVFGYGIYTLLMKIHGTETLEKEFINFLVKHRSSIWIIRTAGSWDLAVWFVARSYTEFLAIFDDIKCEFGDLLKTYELLNIVEDYNYSHLASDFTNGIELSSVKIKKNDSSFFKRLENMPIEVSTYKPNIKISELDLKILDVLSSDARMPLIKLAERLKVSVETVNSHIQKMIENNILQGFMPAISISRLGYQWYGLLVRVKKMDEVEKKQWVDFCKNNKYIIWTARSLGSWDLLIEINCKNIEQLYSIISEIINKFKISDTETLIFLEEHKLTHFADAYYDLFKEK